jgi:glycosyltransferase involved in cell wall biosynthesis
MNDAPRVAIVAASLDILGGQGVQALSLLEALRADGQPVTFLPINPRFPRGLGGLRRLPGVRTVVNQSLYLPGLARLATVDVAHIFSASYASFLLAPAPAMAVARLLNKRVVLHYHSGEADDHLAHWGALVHPWLRLAHHIAVPSEYLRDVFTRYGHHVHVIPNVIDLSRFSYRESRPLRPHLLSTRNLEPHYRVDVILHAYARLKPRVPAATLTIAGYGSEEGRLRRLVATHRLADVRFLGRVEPRDVPRLLDDADVFLNASVVDNQPVSILEAFAAGIPVISTPTGDIGALVRDRETGLQVPTFDPDAMAGAIECLLADPERAAAYAARARDLTARFTWPAVREAWAALYRSSDRNPFKPSCVSHQHLH